jgi:hypothetical protein
MEYAGYIPGDRVDWNAIGKNLLDTYKDVKEKQAGYEAEGQALFKSVDDAVRDTDLMTNKSFEDFVGGSASQVREKLLELKESWERGEIKGEDYRSFVNNIDGSWGNFTQTIGSLDERVTAILQRQQYGANGEQPQGSSLEALLMEQALDLKNVANKKLSIGSRGDMYLYDENDPASVVPFRSMGTMDDIVDNRINVPEAVKNQVGPLGSYIAQQLKPGQVIETIESLTQLPEYKELEANSIQAIVNPSNPRSVAGILTDNSSGNYKYYYNTTVRDQILANQVAIQLEINPNITEEELKAFSDNFLRDKMIQVAPSADGTMQPVISERHIKAAEDIVRAQFRGQLQQSFEKEKRYATSTGGGGGAANTDQELAELWKLTVNAMTASPLGSTSDNNDYLAQLAARSGKYFKRVKFSDGSFGVEVYDMVDDKGTKVRDDSSKREIRTAKALSQYVSKKDVAGANTDWEKGKNIAESTGILPANPKKKFN